MFAGKHYVFLNTIEKAGEDYRPMALQVHRTPTISFMPHTPFIDKLPTKVSGALQLY